MNDLSQMLKSSLFCVWYEVIKNNIILLLNTSTIESTQLYIHRYLYQTRSYPFMEDTIKHVSKKISNSKVWWCIGILDKMSLAVALNWSPKNVKHWKMEMKPRADWQDGDRCCVWRMHQREMLLTIPGLSFFASY